jgi:branched-chain amino acid transport system permease protein
MGNLIGVLFDGIAYGSLLFLISVGLSVTMGLMNFVNLAHGAFAMLGGFVCVTLLSRMGVPFLLSLPLAFLASAAAGFVLERLLYRRLYKASHLDQVLFSIGLTFMSVATATYLFGPSQQPVQLPDWLRGQVSVLGLDLGVYRLFLIGVVIAITLAIGALLTRTRLGAQIRASVDNQQASAGLGINVNRVFSLTFALGSGLAGLGGGLGIDVLGLDPTFPIKYMVYFLLVVAVGGAGTIKGPLLAALVLGVFDVAGKYYVPEVGAFVIYALMVVLLLLFPTGLVGRRSCSRRRLLCTACRMAAGSRWKSCSGWPRWPPISWRPATWC